ncbi:MAG TPA: hypothetical protein PKZ67_09545 [Accumulibacter sp.]|uniref:hypothetical protein n=1 Tax=Candidatus Accumulibacter TaxID=327159 RepID=UPI00110A1857|nr:MULTISPECIES: hypothetical protein [Candidatus Accumulibacter]MBL8401787.1 hypothetical protein [Accumulibacter sp.]HNF92438.1 hypothetical protein [Accumulibacter sp.]
MPIISCDEAFDTRVLAACLAAQPKMSAKVLEMLDLMENAQGNLRRADEAKRRVTEILRETGQELLTGWAGQVADAVTAEARAAAPVVGHVKVRSAGRLPDRLVSRLRLSDPGQCGLCARFPQGLDGFPKGAIVGRQGRRGACKDEATRRTLANR